jgi:aquaporin Z
VLAGDYVRRGAAEFIGTFALIFIGAGSIAFARTLTDIALAHGLVIAVFVSALGFISGGHFNPAVTLGLAAGRRFAWRDTGAYIATQVVAAVVAATMLFVIANGVDGFSAKDSGFATNGYGDRSPGGYSLLACLVIELVLTAIFLIVILGVTDTRAPKGFAPLAIGLSLTLIHLVSIPVTNTSVNPARSIGPALFAGGDAIGQLWLFILAPIAGGLIAGFFYRTMLEEGQPAPLEATTQG